MENTAVYLEQLHSYLGLGLPLKDQPGPPRRLRIFGRLTTLDEDDLMRKLGEIAPDEPVIMDMSNLEGMGSLLHRVFASFASRPGPTGWVASPAALPHLEAIRVPPSTLFPTFEAATKALNAT